MATLKISDRDEVLRRVLAETFTPRFGDIRKQMQAALRASLAAEHPQFVKLAKDPESRKYLATTNVRNFYFIDGEESHIAANPCYGKRADMPAGVYRYLDRESYSSITDGDTAVPCSMSEFKITERKMVKAYKSVWADYVAARDKLGSLLNSYTVREKFAGDFPEFAKYLPLVPTKARLPAVIVKDVRAELSKLGIPQK